MIVLGITGGIGSGKSTVLNYILDNYNAEVLFCDDIAKELIQGDKSLIQRINDRFYPYDILDENDNIDNTKLSNIVFKDNNMLNELNDIVHPAVKKKVLELIDYNKIKGKVDALFIEAALLLEEEYDKIFDCIYVYSEKNTRVNRLIDSRGYSKEKALSIMDNQLDEKEFRNRCKYTIDNNSSSNVMCKNVDELLTNVYGLRRKNVRE